MSTFTFNLVSTSRPLTAWITGQNEGRSHILTSIMTKEGKPGAKWYAPLDGDITQLQQELDPNNFDCKFPVKPGEPTKILLPTDIPMGGGRVWVSYDADLKFSWNPAKDGAKVGLCEPSCSNPDDPNYDKIWAFCEFTYNRKPLEETVVNISYVDSVSIPIALTLEGGKITPGVTSHTIYGLPADGLEVVAREIAQPASDGSHWSDLVVRDANQKLIRVLSPHAVVTPDGLVHLKQYEHYNSTFDKYIDEVWSTYDKSTGKKLRITWGENHFNGTTSGPDTNFIFVPEPGNKVDGLGYDANKVFEFPKPTSAQVWGAAGKNSGFAAGQEKSLWYVQYIGVVLNAGFHRGTLTLNFDQPEQEKWETYYEPTNNKSNFSNHYAKVVHAANQDNKGYCHPYDDQTGASTEDQSGRIKSDSTADMTCTVTIGGLDRPQSKLKARKKQNSMIWNRSQQIAPSKFKRDLSWLGEDLKKDPVSIAVDETGPDDGRDLEKGEHPQLIQDFKHDHHTSKFELLPAVRQILQNLVSKLRTSPIYTSRLQPLFAIINSFLLSILSLSMRAALSRMFILVFVTLMWLFGGSLQQDQSSMSAEDTQKRVLETVIALNETLSGFQS